MDRDDVGGTSLWKHSFAFEDCGRETTTRCRGKRQTNQEIQVRRVRIVQLGAAVAMDAQMGKMAQVGNSHDGGTIDLEHRDECDPEHRHECTKVQNCTMNQNKQCSGLLRSCPTCSARARSRVKHPAGWLHPGCACIWTNDWE